MIAAAATLCSVLSELLSTMGDDCSRPSMAYTISAELAGAAQRTPVPNLHTHTHTHIYLHICLDDTAVPPLTAQNLFEFLEVPNHTYQLLCWSQPIPAFTHPCLPLSPATPRTPAPMAECVCMAWLTRRVVMTILTIIFNQKK